MVAPMAEQTSRRFTISIADVGEMVGSNSGEDLVEASRAVAKRRRVDPAFGEGQRSVAWPNSAGRRGARSKEGQVDASEVNAVGQFLGNGREVRH